MSSFRDTLKQSDAIVGAVMDTRRVWGMLRYSSINGRLIRQYLDTHDVRKLQIGAGPTALAGWLSTDISPRNDTTACLDATKPFPFEDATFDYIYSEHMIEHITWQQGLTMLRECRRVLKPDGVIRIATPDLKVLLDLYAGAKTPAQEKYVRWITDTFLEGVEVYRPAFVINNAFHNWGHQCIYDTEMMTMALLATGFMDIQQCGYGDSQNSHLRGIESHGKNIDDHDMAAFETMIFEAKPAPQPAPL